MKIVTEAKGKDCEIEEIYCLLGLTPEQTAFPAAVRTVSKGKTGQLQFDVSYYEYLHKKGMMAMHDHHVAGAIQKRMQNLSGSNQAREFRLLRAYEKDPEEAQNYDPHFEAVVKRIVLIEFFYLLKREGVREAFENSTMLMTAN